MAERADREDRVEVRRSIFSNAPAILLAVSDFGRRYVDIIAW